MMGRGGEFLRIQVTIDITKALPQCCKLWFDNEHVGWALLSSSSFLIFAIGAVG